MASALLVIGATVVMLAMVAVGRSLPRMSAMAAHRGIPAAAALHGASAAVAVALSAGIAATLWLALELADTGGAIGQRPILEQLLPLAVAFGLGGCLVMLPWREEWVSAELRRMAWTVPSAALGVLLIDVALVGGAAMVWVSAVGWLLAGAVLLVLARVLARDGQRTR